MVEFELSQDINSKVKRSLANNKWREVAEDIGGCGLREVDKIDMKNLDSLISE